MAETINCHLDGDYCNCICNCVAFLTNNKRATVNSLIIDENLYTFSYTFTNSDPAISNIVFCIECPTSKIIISSANTTISVTGYTSTTSENFIECFTPACEMSAENRFYVDYDVVNEQCCKYQGIKIDINPAGTIQEIEFILTFNLPDSLVFDFTSGNMKIKSGQNTDIINNICMPGCPNCNIQDSVCNMWFRESNILNSNKDVFIHFSQLILPETLDLSTISVSELESKVRSISKIENSSANLICNTAKVLEQLNQLDVNTCYTVCTNC